MSEVLPVTLDTEADRQDWRLLAAAIVGRPDLFPQADAVLFDANEWKQAAQCALDGDHSDLCWMVARQDCFEEFCEWQRADYDNREDTCFSDWLVSRARWNRPNMYEAALNRNEREGV